MLYTLTQGTLESENGLHYSLYGGVEHAPDRSFAIKELLPLVAIPAVAIALLAAVINFHVPRIGSAAGGTNENTKGANGSVLHSLVLSSATSSKSSTDKHTTSSTPAASATNPLANNSLGTGLPSTSFTMTPLGNDNGQGIIGGMGSGGGTTVPSTESITPTPTPTPTSTSVNVSDPTGSVTTTTTVSGTTAQVDASVTVPTTDKQLISTSTTIDP